MSALELSDGDFDWLAALIEEGSGICIPRSEKSLLGERIAGMAGESGCSAFSELRAKLESDAQGRVRDRLIEAASNRETGWFREDATWAILREHLLPRFVEERREGARDKARIWCAACATGEEAYSVGICILDYLEQEKCADVSADDFEVVGSDMSAAALYVAISGRYPQASVEAGLAEDQRAAHLEEKRGAWGVSARLKRLVRFHRVNLLTDFAGLGSFDLIICQNVLCYFNEERRRDVLARVGRTLQQPGHLVLGRSERLPASASDFTRRTLGGHECYETTAPAG